MRSSAPGASRTVRESTLEAIANAMRDGTLALIRPVTTLTDGRWVARTRWMPDRARLLGDLDDRVLDLAALAHDQVGELVDDQDDVRHPLARRRRRGAVARLALKAAMLRTLWRGQQLVALLHLADRPVEHGLRLVRLDDHVLEQVRQAVVRRQLDPLEVDQDQPDLVRAGAHQQARDERVDAHALARAGGAGDRAGGASWRGRPRRPCPTRRGRGRTSAGSSSRASGSRRRAAGSRRPR